MLMRCRLVSIFGVRLRLIGWDGLVRLLTFGLCVVLIRLVLSGGLGWFLRWIEVGLVWCLMVVVRAAWGVGSYHVIPLWGLCYEG